MTATAPLVAQQPLTAAAVDQRVELLLSRMTVEEGIGMLGGVHDFNTPGLARLGVPELGMSDSPFGVRATGPSTLYVGGIGLAATWDTELAQRVGTELGRDARARGRHFTLGPGVNMYRSPLNGRNFEYYGEDPYLGSRIVVGFINGVQSQGVSATVKHYVGNQSEYARNLTDSRIDERALREIYLPIFEAAVKEAHVGAVMNAYNMTNGEYMTANRRLIVDVLKNEWGFRGLVISDWGAVHDAAGAANGGTDIEMPNPAHFNLDSLRPLLQRGVVTQETIDDKVRRLLRTALRFGWMDRPQLDASIPRYSQRGRAAALQGARESMVLLKNAQALLPLDRGRVKTIAVIGPNAFPGVPLGFGSAAIPTYHTISFLEGISDHLDSTATVHHSRGIPSTANVVVGTAFTTSVAGDTAGLTAELFDNQQLSGAPTSTRVDRNVNVGTPPDLAALASGEPNDPSIFGPSRPYGARWTGYYTPRNAGQFDIVVQQGSFENAGYRLSVDDRLVTDRWTENRAMLQGTVVKMDARPHKVVLEYHTMAGFGSPVIRMGIMPRDRWVDSATVALASAADAVVLAVGFDPHSEGENWDRTFQLPPGQEELIRRVAAVNRNVIVVVTSGGGVDMSRWIDSVPAVIQAWYPGQEGGTALAEILVGDVNPSGHLPVTFDRHLEDNPSTASYYPVPGTNRVEYRESIFAGYRGVAKRGVTPLFPFGHGLSYTTFRYEHLAVTPVAGTTGPGARWNISFDVTNSGTRAGAAVPQMYVGKRVSATPRPPRELKGFARVMLQPGETRHVVLPLDVRALAFFDVARHEWRAEAGEFGVMLGRSSGDSALETSLTLARTTTIPLR